MSLKPRIYALAFRIFVQQFRCSIAYIKQMTQTPFTRARAHTHTQRTYISLNRSWKRWNAYFAVPVNWAKSNISIRWLILYVWSNSNVIFLVSFASSDKEDVCVWVLRSFAPITRTTRQMKFNIIPLILKICVAYRLFRLFIFFFFFRFLVGIGLYVRAHQLPLTPTLANHLVFQLQNRCVHG